MKHASNSASRGRRSRHPGGAPRGGRGFTLLEILLVLAVMAIGAALVLPALVKPAGTQLRTAAGSVVAGLRQTRDEAVSRQRTTTVTVDVEARQFHIDASNLRRQLPQEVQLSLFTARSELLDGKRGRIRFFPDGSSTGGRVTLSSGERRYYVDVDWLTGQVRVRAGSASDRLELPRGQVALGS